MVENKTSNNPEILSMQKKRNGFHGKYLSICKSKNLTPVPEVKAKQKNFQVLDFHADRIRPQDWFPICNSLRNDKTLKFVAIRLRKNNELVLEEIDTMKKAKAVQTHPVIYTKFLFIELVEALQRLMTKNNLLETLIIEGLPLYGHYMLSFVKGLAQNNSITTLSFARSQIGDEACDYLCSTIKHMMEIKTLNLSGCNLGIKGADAIANLIKYQKIQRLSDAWTQSLRYQNIDSESFPGLRKVSLNNNPEIGNEGLEVLLQSLCDDVWIKDLEMQNCGISDEGAQSIIKCLGINKTIQSFNIAGNPDVSEHLHHHILINLGHVDQENSDSSDSKSSSETMTKAKLLENLKYSMDMIEVEVFRRKKAELLNEKLNQQLKEAQKEIMLQNAVRVPDGFTLIADETLNELLNRKREERLPRVIVNRRKCHLTAPRKVRSVIVPKPKYQDEKTSISEHVIKSVVDIKKPSVVESNIGDNSAIINTKSMSGTELLKMFVKKKKESQPPDDASATLGIIDPRKLFYNNIKNVPANSEDDSDD